MCDSLASILEDNPWTEMAQKLEDAMKVNPSALSGSFVLKRDEAVLNSFGCLPGNKTSQLLLNLPPQPFIGSPEAKIWILQFNPGYSETIDSFDYLGIDNLPKHDSHKSKTVSSLNERIDLLCSQYRFEENAFYALAQEFHTFKKGFRQERGIFLWYQETLFPRNDGCFSFVAEQKREQFCRDNIFVIEFFPYHSKIFNFNIFPFLPSFEFWRRLIRYGLKNEKIMLCHGLRSKNSVTACALASIDGFESAIKNGNIYTIVPPGQGRGRLILKSRCVTPLRQGSTQLSDFCNQLQEEKKYC